MLTFFFPALAALRGFAVRRHRRLSARVLSRHGPQAGTTTAE